MTVSLDTTIQGLQMARSILHLDSVRPWSNNCNSMNKWINVNINEQIRKLELLGKNQNHTERTNS